MAIKKIITYQCDKCRRTKDYQASILNAFVNLCSITKNCTGRLHPIATKNLRNVLPSSPEAGLTDWFSRFENPTKTIIKEETISYANLASNYKYALTLAVKKETTNCSSFELQFAVQQSESTSFIEYDFYMTTPFTQVIGKDSSSSARILKFTSADSVSVFKNGIELTEGSAVSEYKLLFNNSNGYAIQFNQEISTSTLIKVIVYQAQQIFLTEPLIFTKNSEIANNKDNQTSWLNVLNVNINNEEYVLYSCLDISNIPSNKLLNIYPNNNQISNQLPNTEIISTDLNDYYFLISYMPYSNVDRAYDIVCNLSNLAEADTNIRIFSTSSEKRLEISSLSAQYPLLPIQPLMYRDISTEKVEALTAVIYQSTFPNNFNIIGPV